MITIINYGMGNLGSVLNMYRRLGVPARISSDRDEILSAEKLILPGVGAFDAGMQRLHELDLVKPLTDKVKSDRTPVLGLCLGMQLLTGSSEEGVLPGLGWIEGRTVRFRVDPAQANLKIPHMGWNTTEVCKVSPLVSGLEQDARYYFVHSYHITCDDPDDVVALTHHGYDFPAIIHRGNIMGTQFHPEKSHRFGMQLLKNFAEQF